MLPFARDSQLPAESTRGETDTVILSVSGAVNSLVRRLGCIGQHSDRTTNRTSGTWMMDQISSNGFHNL